MSKIAIYPGTFDPVTNGHLDIIKRTSAIFSHIIIAIADKSMAKHPIFSIEQRVVMMKSCIKEAKIKNVKVKSFDNLLVDFAKENKSNIIVRGLRAVSDFEYELQIGYAHRSLNGNIETIYFMPSLENAFISSSIVRAILFHKGGVSHLVPKSVVDIIKTIKIQKI